LGNVAANSYMINNIVWDNQAVSNAGIHIVSGTLQAVNCDIQGGWTGTGNINVNPELIADSLSDSSPCIGTGTLSHNFGSVVCEASSKDIYGRSRPYPAGSMPDVGAWESRLDVQTNIHNYWIDKLPMAFALYQNYPNPFNPVTAIEYQLPKFSHVDLSIYNLLGQKVATLVNKKQMAGSYNVEWDASGFASGVYFYRLETEQGFSQTKKLILVQ